MTNLPQCCGVYKCQLIERKKETFSMKKSISLVPEKVGLREKIFILIIIYLKHTFIKAERQIK